MADKNITLRQKNTSGVYDKLYTKTTATQSKLSTETAALFGDGTADADAALAKIADTVKSIGNVQVKVVDPNGNPIQGARITGLYGTPTTASDGTAHGVLQTNPISISSPYIDLKDQTADASGYAGSFNVLTVTLPIVGENNVKRITSSQTVKFKLAKTVDVCCVGGGGGGANYAQSPYGQHAVYQGSGGGGGGIVNAFGMTIAADENYQLYVGSGGATREVGQSDGSGYDGGSSNFLGISANGGGGGVADLTGVDGSILSVSAGKAGYTGCGDGGYADGSGQKSNVGGSNTTVSEFNDNTIFYSGGGGSGSGARKAGGTPNGAAGAYQNGIAPINATTAGVGGGGGGGMSTRLMSGSYITGFASSGGPGLVAIRFHF